MWANAKTDGRPLLNAAKFGWCPLLECRAVMLPIQENARLGRKVKFAHGKIPSGGNSPQKCIIWCTSTGDGQRSCKVWLASGERRRCSNEANMRNPLQFAAVPKHPKQCQPLVGRSSPYCEDMWRTYCCLTSFFPTVNACLSWEDTAWQSCAMVHKLRFFASFLRPVFPVSHV